jgi:hypothetical protein
MSVHQGRLASLSRSRYFGGFANVAYVATYKTHLAAARNAVADGPFRPLTSRAIERELIRSPVHEVEDLLLPVVGFNRDCFVGTSSRIPIPATTSTAWQSGLRRARTEALGFPTLCRSERLRATLVAHLTVSNVQLALDQILHWAFCW